MENGECKIVCTEIVENENAVAVSNDTLYIEEQGKYKWYQKVGIFTEATRIDVYLPERSYTVISIIRIAVILHSGM